MAQGDKADRAQLRRVIDRLAPDDVLMVTRLDQLARSTRDLLNTLAANLPVPGESGFGFAPEEPNVGIQLTAAASRAKSLSTARSLHRTCR